MTSRDVRVLFVDINATFLNPTRALVGLALRHSCNTRFFGPGYISTECLQKGLIRFVEEEGPFAIVAASPHVVFGDVYNLAPEAVERAYWVPCPASDVKLLGQVTLEFERLRELGVVRVALFLETDYYNWRAREIEALQRRADYVIAFGPEFWRHKAELPNLGKETFAKQATDAWADWVHANAERVASQLHFVSDSEFRWARLAHRQRDWGMPGRDLSSNGPRCRLARVNSPRSCRHCRPRLRRRTVDRRPPHGDHATVVT